MYARQCAGLAVDPQRELCRCAHGARDEQIQRRGRVELKAQRSARLHVAIDVERGLPVSGDGQRPARLDPREVKMAARKVDLPEVRALRRARRQTDRAVVVGRGPVGGDHRRDWNDVRTIAGSRDRGHARDRPADRDVAGQGLHDGGVAVHRYRSARRKRSAEVEVSPHFARGRRLKVAGGEKIAAHRDVRGPRLRLVRPDASPEPAVGGALGAVEAVGREVRACLDRPAGAESVSERGLGEDARACRAAVASGGGVSGVATLTAVGDLAHALDGRRPERDACGRGLPTRIPLRCPTAPRRAGKRQEDDKSPRISSVRVHERPRFEPQTSERSPPTKEWKTTQRRAQRRAYRTRRSGIQ